MKYTLSDLTNYINEGQIKSWKVKSGDIIQKGDLLAALESTKVNLELLAPCDGQIGKLIAHGSIDKDSEILEII